MNTMSIVKLNQRLKQGHKEVAALKSGNNYASVHAVFHGVGEKHEHLPAEEVGGALLLHDYSEAPYPLSPEVTVALGVLDHDGDMDWWIHLDADEAEELGALLMALAARKRRNS